MDKLVFNKRLGEYIRQKRMELKLSQPQLADRLGLDYQYISRVERGLISPTLYWIVGLSNAMDLPLETFIKEFTDYSGLDTESIKA